MEGHEIRGSVDGSKMSKGGELGGDDASLSSDSRKRPLEKEASGARVAAVSSSDAADQEEKGSESGSAAKRPKFDPEKGPEFTREKVTLSEIFCDKDVKISKCKLEATGTKGYSTVFGTHTMPPGTYYYEIKVGGTGHVRVGWATSSTSLQAPCGFDHFGYSYGSRRGCKFHVKTIKYGEPFGAGDVIGALISLPGKRRKKSFSKGGGNKARPIHRCRK
eukprot:jgi/Bigna1/87715/estExt_fgenesh1_pg.C_230122